MFFTTAGFSEETSDPAESVLFSTTEPVYFSADTITYERKTGIVTGNGNVEIVQDGYALDGDKLVINIPREKAEIEGDVVASGKGARIEGTRGTYDLATHEGVFYQARGYSEPWYVSAKEIRRNPEGAYTVKNASLTTCSEPKPHYALRAKSVTVVPDERITGRKLTLFAGPVPLFYFPYYSQTFGSRVPPIEVDAGSQSDLGGFLGLAYNVEPAEGISLKPNVKAYTKSGIGVGLDGRLSLFDGDGNGSFKTFYISDLNNNNTDKPGVGEDRGMAYAFYRQAFPHDWNAAVRAEYDSDGEFLKDFFFSEYEDREPPRSYLNVERTGLHNVVSLLAEPRLADHVDEVERLPQLTLALLEQRVGDTGFFFSAQNESAYLNAEPADFHTARNFSEARLAYPVRLWKALELAPFVEGDATYYSDTVEPEDSEYRLSWSSGVSAQTQLQRVFASPFPMYTAFRHLIVPSVTYRFRPTPDERPNDLLQFDAIDRIDRENSVEVEVRNYLSAKRPDGVRRQLVQYEVTADLEFDDGKDKLAQLENQLWITPVPNWELLVGAFSDFREDTRNDFVNAVIRYVRPDAFEAYAGMVYQDTPISPRNTQFVYSFSKAFGPMWRAGIEQRYDFSDSEFSYQELWLWHRLDCVEALLTFRDRRAATSVMVLVNITAFPLGRIQRKTAIKPIEENKPWPTYW